MTSTSQAATFDAALGFKHVVGISACVTDIGDGTSVLLNYTWCGWPYRRDLGMRGVHPYGSYEKAVTCPDCKHLIECGENCTHLDAAI
jgi:hypothetical protein